MIEVYLSIIVSLFVSMVLTPVVTRRANSLKLVDVPDFRKAHTGAIPRTGGIAIAIGALLPSAILLYPNGAPSGYIAGALVILAFGLWDDHSSLDYRLKL